MTVKITKEQILKVIKNGKVSYRTVGGHMTPLQVKRYLLKIADHLDELKEVDLSIAFGRRQKASKVASHKASSCRTGFQNQREL